MTNDHFTIFNDKAFDYNYFKFKNDFINDKPKKSEIIIYKLE